MRLLKIAAYQQCCHKSLAVESEILSTLCGCFRWRILVDKKRHRDSPTYSHVIGNFREIGRSPGWLWVCSKKSRQVSGKIIILETSSVSSGSKYFMATYLLSTRTFVNGTHLSTETRVNIRNYSVDISVSYFETIFVKFETIHMMCKWIEEWNMRDIQLKEAKFAVASWTNLAKLCCSHSS